MSAEGKHTFFKQSAWMVGATMAGGIFMMLVHTVARSMGPIDYSEFFALLRILILLGIPTAGLQVIFAQQAAAAITELQSEQLTRTVRVVLATSFAIWLVMAAGVFLAQDRILGSLKISNPAALWVTMLVVLASLWLPILRGLLQGQQNFFGLGWVAILDGVGRFAAVALIVMLLGGKAAGAMTGALLGQLASLALGIWLMRRLLVSAGKKIDWTAWLKRVIPLTIGIGVLLFVQNADVVFVKGVFDEERAALYMPAAMIGFALIQFAGPITAVMFPKVVRSVARSEKTDAVRLTFFTTALVGIGASLVCTLFPDLPIRIIYANDARYLGATPIVPWFTWCMSFMILAAVLVNNLLARERFAIVPWMLLLSGAYIAALYAQREALLMMETIAALKRVVQTLGGFTLLLLALSVWFTWGRAPRAANDKQRVTHDSDTQALQQRISAATKTGS